MSSLEYLILISNIVYHYFYLFSRESEEQNDSSFLPTVRIQHAAIQRNIRCLNAYHYNRLRRIRNMRWEFGSVLPPEVKYSFSDEELTWFKDYSRSLATYMRSIGESGGVNLCVDNKPPKSLYIEVECLSDYGQFELSNGTIIHLKKNTRYFLPHRDCEEFIVQGIFKHILL